MQPIIEIHNLGKKYKLANILPYLSLRDNLTDSIKHFFNRKRKIQNDFWALKNINLEIRASERVGIIGRNGAGKSTLLKIISRITPPTLGSVVIYGRVASLLEVGTGFHPELTGKENIYLNGSILGLRKKEIDEKMNAIIDFSGVQKFMDTPLKHYSTGMQLRLAFSVAAHLEPEILLIDEVLAVGDMEFQQKCIGKMEEVSRSDGRTILFVSHNMNAIKSFCNSVVLLDKGEIKFKGATEDGINIYLKNVLPQTSVGFYQEEIPGKLVYFKRLEIVNAQAKDSFIFPIDSEIKIYTEMINRSGEKGLKIGLAINDAFDKRALISFNELVNDSEIIKNIVSLPKAIFTPGLYSVDLSIFNNYELFDLKKNILSFEISKENTKYEGLQYDYGVIHQECIWEDL